MEHSESLTELGTALALAQGEIENAHKNAANPHFKSTYADLAEIINTVRPVLTRHGLSVVQVPAFADGVVFVETMLLHRSGEWIKGTAGAPATKQDAQGVGSAVTYLRRYSLAAICAIAQEDDDGAAASRRPEQKRTKSDRPEKVFQVCTGGQATFIRQLMKSHVFTDDERAAINAKIDAGKLSKNKAVEHIGWLQAEIDRRKAIEEAELAEAQA